MRRKKYLLDKEQEELLNKFLNEKRAESQVKSTTLKNYEKSLSILGTYLGKNFKQVTEEDLKGFFGELERKREKGEISDSSIRLYRVCIRAFYQWLDRNNDSSRADWIKIPSIKTKIKSEDLLDREEIKRLINSARTLRDRALLSVLLESGIRREELRGLNVGSVIPTNYGFILSVEGKTGPRTIPIISSAGILGEYLSTLPSDKNSPLWVSSSGRRLSAISIWRIIKNCAKRAGINKRIYVHLMRHTRATELSTKLSDQTMKGFFGWKPTSNMPGVYSHLSGKEVVREVLRVSGIKVEDKENALGQLICPRCKEPNISANEYCYRCGTPLTREAETWYPESVVRELEMRIESLEGKAKKPN
ncbi:MAG: tyrosine-type recombinase/integrase [Candidatus Jordarchaeaceae archaeon]